LLLDEPTNGLDPQGVREFYVILEQLRTDGLTAVLSSHVLAQIQQRVDRLALMKDGRIRALGSLQSLREESNFPLAIQVKVHNGAEGMLRRTLPESEVIRVTGSTAHLQCDRSRKMAVLSALSGLGQHVLDIHVEEPSLEDIFLGHTERAP
jgi:Cu-processing system ATP-binding protein